MFSVGFLIVSAARMAVCSWLIVESPQVAVGHREYLHVFGGDYLTHDGTGIRDYIHVQDLANGHVCALEMLEQTYKGQCTPINLGTGIDHSVLDVVKAFESACEKKYLTKYNLAESEIRRQIGQIHPKQKNYLAGMPNVRYKKYVAMLGDGKSKILMDIQRNEK